MSDAPKLYTERDLVLAKRFAFADGLGDAKRNSAAAALWSYPAMQLRARRKYPLPSVTRPRIVRVTDKAWADREFRYVGGQLQSRTRGLGPSAQAYPWTPLAQITPTPETVTVLADLIARPTEQVEADE